MSHYHPIVKKHKIIPYFFRKLFPFGFRNIETPIYLLYNSRKYNKSLENRNGNN